ncbi:uncharacterized protein LOC109534747 [Dendroctonus ponderosae]|uniref:uncharacterized protein LOC109534747 n=1 Tax=Dendroctonus ponderosae TaxID=77166 RepID=UPI002035D2B5|nr:uncharacterized protein LOC109534747 [Dendroctonus ponderosae]
MATLMVHYPCQLSLGIMDELQKNFTVFFWIMMAGGALRFVLLSLAGLNLGQSGPNLEILLANLHQLQPIRNCIIFTESDAVRDSIRTFHKFVPVIVVNIQERRAGEDYNSTWRKSIETHLSNYYNVYFTFLEKSQQFERSFSKIASLNFWKARQRNVFVGNFTLDQVEVYSERAFRNNWATNLVFTNSSFASLSRYDHFGKVLRTQKSADLIFLDTASDFHGNRFEAAMFPSLLARWNGHRYEGRDGSLLLELTKQLNATVKYRHFPAGDYGDIYPNGTCTGTFKEVLEGRSHASFNGRFMAREYLRIVDYTYPHDIHSLVVMLPVRSKAEGNLLRVLPLLPHALGAALLVLFDVYLKFFSHTPLGKILLVNTQLLANLPVYPLPVKYYRMLLMALTVYYFYLIADLQAKLTSVLTAKESEPELTRISEAASLAYRFSTEDIFRITLERFEGADQEYVSEILGKNSFYPTQEFARRMSKCVKDEAFLTVEKLAAAYTQLTVDEQGYQKKCYYKVAQQLNPAQLTFVFRYGTPILGKVNRVILSSIEAGLMEFWQRSRRNVLRYATARSPTQITFGNFQLLARGIWLSWIATFAVFLVELFLGRLHGGQPQRA